jgi:hypothetical protein
VTEGETRHAWDRFQDDIRGLAGELKRHYREDEGTAGGAELNRSLEQLRQAADAVFRSVEAASTDPDVRAKTRQTARSFGEALSKTFRDLGDELEKAVRRRDGSGR